MPRINADVRAALGYWWNLVTDAALNGFTTTETVSIAADIAKDFGQNVSFNESKSIAVLYGYARRMDNSSRAFQAAAPDAPITPDMIATPPYARELAEQNAYPLYHVKFYYTYLDQAGNEQTDVRTSVQPLGLPDTVGGITAMVQDDAQGFALKYGHQLISAIPFQILAV